MKIRILLALLTALLISASITAAPAQADKRCNLLNPRYCTAFEQRPALLPSTIQPKKLTANAVYSYIDAAVKDLDKQWTAWFLSNGLREPWIQYDIVQPGKYGTSKCEAKPVPSDYENAFYCPLDMFVGTDNVTHHGKLVLPLVAFYKMWNGNVFGKNSKTKGDFGAGSIVAHEFGHSVTQSISEQRNIPKPVQKNNELIADCFAGNWTYAINLHGILEIGDVQEAIAAISSIGDYEYNNPGHHGTPAEREKAYRTGLSGQPMSCITTYWPEAVRR
jgi:predicted metalloprotease